MCRGSLWQEQVPATGGGCRGTHADVATALNRTEPFAARLRCRQGCLPRQPQGAGCPARLHGGDGNREIRRVSEALMEPWFGRWRLKTETAQHREE